MKTSIALLVLAIAAVVAFEPFEENNYQSVEPAPKVAVPESIPEIEAQIPEQKHTIVTRATGCGAASCNQFCRKLGHARGVCIGTYCQCRFQ